MRKSRLFFNAYTAGIRRGMYPGKTKAAREWYRMAAGQVRGIGDRRKFMKQEMRDFRRKELYPGFLYMYMYDPKWKDELPYYDICPIVFPFRKLEDGWLGLNLHYLEPKLRAVLMDELYTIASNDRYNDNTKLMLSYAVLQDIANSNLYKPCIKRYLSSHVKTKIHKIPADYWDFALFLPTERFVKATKQEVWADSKRKAGHIKEGYARFIEPSVTQPAGFAQLASGSI